MGLKVIERMANYNNNIDVVFQKERETISFEAPKGCKELIKQYLHGNENSTDLLNKALYYEIQKRKIEAQENKKYICDKEQMEYYNEDLTDLRHDLEMDKYFDIQDQEIGLQLGFYSLNVYDLAQKYRNLRLSLIIDSMYRFDLTVEPNEPLPECHAYIDIINYPRVGKFLEENELGVNQFADHLVRGMRCALYKINIDKLCKFGVEGSNYYKFEKGTISQEYKECHGISFEKRKKRSTIEFKE